MTAHETNSSRLQLLAFALPMGIFLAFFALKSALALLGHSFWLESSEYWIYPAQTIVCGVVVLCFWKQYCFSQPRGLLFTVALGIFVFVLWISPQIFFGFGPRRDGFNPDLFQQSSSYYATVALRFLRLVIVVPFVEEIFWRGFLLRYLMQEKFWTLPIGAFSWLSFGVVTLGFGFEHSAADRVAAFITGALYNCVAYRTKSLSSCVLAHAITNLLLGLWIMHSKQWGFW